METKLLKIPSGEGVTGRSSCVLSQAADAELSESFLFGSTHGRNLVHASETGDQASNLFLTCLDTALILCLPASTASQVAL